MIKSWMKGIGIGLVGVALGCTGAGSADTEITGRLGEIRGGFPIANPRADSQVLITVPGSGSGTGVLLSQEWVLTAAHVVDIRRMNIPGVTVKLGNASDTGAQVRNAVAVYHHPAHSLAVGSGPSNPSQVDVALVRVSPPFSASITRSISSVSNSALLNTSPICNGYGLTVEGNFSTAGTLTFGSVFVAAVNTNFARVVPGVANNIHLPGDSGGPCFDAFGGVVGVMSTDGVAVPVTEGFIVPADAFRGWANGIVANCGGRNPGSSTFCSAECPCIYGNGDCEDGQCSTGNVCATDVGPGFGMSLTTDVCTTSFCAGDTLGSSTFCAPSSDNTQTCPCGYGGGDCDSSSECLAGFTCATDYGPMFNMTPTTDVCVPTACANRSIGSSTFCSAACPCGYGGGDCDSDSECMPGLVCGGTDYGSAFNMTSATDVCVPAACAGRTPYASTFCSPDCPCGMGGGDCDSDIDCMPGLVCVDNIGEQFGASAATDICMRP
jgi:hypothetical protein